MKLVKAVRWVSYARSIRRNIRRGTNGDGPLPRETLQDTSGQLTGLQMILIDLVQLQISSSRMYDQRAEEACHLTKQLLCIAGTAWKAAAAVVISAAISTLQKPRNVLGTMLGRRGFIGGL